jgi:hypothetical protein
MGRTDIRFRQNDAIGQNDLTLRDGLALQFPQALQGIDHRRHGGRTENPRQIRLFGE